MKRRKDRPPLVQRLLADKIGLMVDLDDPDSFAFHQAIGIAGENPQALRDRWKLSLQVSENVAVTADLGRIITAAGQDLPSDLRPQHHMLFSEHGFVWLEQPIIWAPTDQSGPVSVRALSFHHGTGGGRRWVGTKAGIEVNLWAEAPDGTLATCGSDFMPYGLTGSPERTVYEVERGIERVEIADDPLSPEARFVLALNSFMKTQLPARTDWPAPKSRMGGLAAAGLPPTGVTVIDLRRRAPSKRDGHGQGSALTHRHIVRGHWHAYWVGRSHPHHSGTTDEREKVHIYVNPYIKGPEWGEFAATEKVNLVRR